MEEILKLMQDYEIRHNMIDNTKLELYTDQSGSVKNWVKEIELFDFNSIPELIEKLKQ